VTPVVVIRAFTVGAALGLLAASVLEARLLGDGLLVYLGGGNDRGGGQAAGPGLDRQTPVGLGALESSGYASTP
jgi:hypothetical protein